MISWISLRKSEPPQIPMLQEWHINADLHHPRAEAWHLAGTAPTITADVLQQVPTWPRRLDEHSAAGHFVWGTCADGRGVQGLQRQVRDCCLRGRRKWEGVQLVGGTVERNWCMGGAGGRNICGAGLWAGVKYYRYLLQFIAIPSVSSILIGYPHGT